MSKVKIAKKIVEYRIDQAEEAPAEQAKVAPVIQQDHESNVVRMHEKLDRPEMLRGSTYKVKTPVDDHAMYVTINDIVLNLDTEHESQRPFEIFVNSKNLDHYQWIVALTRIMSAVFRKGGDVTFLVDELKAVFDPRGGYWKPGGKYMPSIIAELGHIVEKHLQYIGMLPQEGLDPHQQELIEKKRKEYEASRAQPDMLVENESAGSPISDGGAIEGAQMCSKCHDKAVVLMDGCMTCLSCGDSKCG
ncbi:MAG: NrdJb [Gammaproteobacteria bacterium]|nr:NrdJb [Gammaproteobacteria bacterium]NND54307.1 NrdJb [Gammaproteobacteria bacterium]